MFATGENGNSASCHKLYGDLASVDGAKIRPAFVSLCISIRKHKVYPKDSGHSPNCTHLCGIWGRRAVLYSSGIVLLCLLQVVHYNL
jgi:hypothetical protein